MKRGMLAVLFLVLLCSAAWGEVWYRYQGTFSVNLYRIAGETERWSAEFYVLLCYQTTPWSISFERVGGGSYFSGEFDQEGRKLQFRASRPGGEETGVGRGSFNAKATTLNLQGSSFYRGAGVGARSSFLQHRFRGKFVDIIVRP